MSWPRFVSKLALAACLLAVLGASACSRGDSSRSPAQSTATARPSAKVGLQLRPEPIGAAIGRPPWIAHVTTVDLDHDGRLDVLACEAQDNQVVWLRQLPIGGFEEKVVGMNLKAPVHVEPCDIDGDGDLDLLVASMGFVFPNNDRIGTVFVLENDGRQNFTPHAVLEHTERVTDVRGADFNGDGKLDLAVAQFGYDQGAVCWLERTGPWEFQRHVLLELSGAINVCVADFNGDGKPDIAAVVSQQWEEIYYFENTGSGFARKRIWGSTNEDYGSSGISVCDLNGDGRPDILYTNGDGFGPATTPGPRPWHGVQWLENVGGGSFRFHRLGDLPGAYSPLGVDLDGDGAMDVVAVAAYAGRNNPGARPASLVWFRNDGKQQFERRMLATAPQDLLTVAAGDFNRNGRATLVTGGFYVTPPYRDMSRITLWRR
jgi:hypothetical protein